MSQKPVDVSKLKNARTLIIIEADIPATIGSIFFECKCGYFIASNYSDIIIRDENLKISKKGKTGLVQLLSLLPSSYPGHSILTEDIGEIVDDHKCNCFGHGKRFLIHGRLKNAELRGCSNI